MLSLSALPLDPAALSQAGEVLAHPLLAVTTYAEQLAPDVPFLSWLSNAVVISLIAAVLIFLLCRAATSRMARVPGTVQNLMEMLVDAIYGGIESMLGPKLTKQAFPILATLFFFILTVNWLGLVPGVGTVGWGAPADGPLSLQTDGHIRPLLRPAGADLNMNLPIAFAFMIVWTIIVVKDNGIVGFFKHLFAPKGKAANPAMNILLVLVFLFVGVLEIISISIRPFSLSLRLYGNIYAGENLLHTMSSLGETIGLKGIWAFLSRVIIPIPFYFLELLVGFLQAVVFTLLCTVYIQLSAAHDDHHDEEHAH